MGVAPWVMTRVSQDAVGQLLSISLSLLCHDPDCDELNSSHSFTFCVGHPEGLDKCLLHTLHYR